MTQGRGPAPRHRAVRGWEQGQARHTSRGSACLHQEEGLAVCVDRIMLLDKPSAELTNIVKIERYFQHILFNSILSIRAINIFSIGKQYCEINYYFFHVYKDNHFYWRRLAELTRCFMETSPEIPILRAQQITMKIHGFWNMSNDLNGKWKGTIEFGLWAGDYKFRITIHKV